MLLRTVYFEFNHLFSLDNLRRDMNYPFGFNPIHAVWTSTVRRQFEYNRSNESVKFQTFSNIIPPNIYVCYTNKIGIFCPLAQFNSAAVK